MPTVLIGRHQFVIFLLGTTWIVKEITVIFFRKIFCWSFCCSNGLQKETLQEAESSSCSSDCGCEASSEEEEGG
jgi:hypothetical protein